MYVRRTAVTWKPGFSSKIATGRLPSRKTSPRRAQDFVKIGNGKLMAARDRCCWIRAALDRVVYGVVTDIPIKRCCTLRGYLFKVSRLRLSAVLFGFAYQGEGETTSRT